jgi:DNA polymerase III delta prime subunit
MNNDHMLWVERYRPHTIADCVLPDDLKKTFQEYVNNKEIPNMIFSGGPGIGKTTVARALCDEIGLDYILINGSNESGIDTLRTKIVGYASAVSLMGGRKVIIIDEADYLNPNSTQPAFRGVIEEFAGNCSFIFTCNYKNKLIPPLHSRCAVIDFKIPNDIKPKIAAAFLKRVEEVLVNEKIEYDRKAVIELVKKYFPDYRRVLNELQRYSVTGKIDVGVLAANSDSKISEAIEFLKQKDFRSLRKWVGQNSDNDAQKIMREIYERLNDIVKPEFGPVAVVILGKYQYQDAFVSDHEVNLMAFMTEIMLECSMRDS